MECIDQGTLNNGECSAYYDGNVFCIQEVDGFYAKTTHTCRTAYSILKYADDNNLKLIDRKKWQYYYDNAIY